MTAIPALPRWDGDVAAARALQSELASRVVLRDDFAKPLLVVAGLEAGFVDDGATAWAAAVVLDAATLQPLESHVARQATLMPRIPDLLTFRQLPVMLDALASLRHVPDLVFVHGHGIAHPRRLGIASHFGVASGLPSIGVADDILLGTHAMLHAICGAHTPLRDNGVQVGWVLRSQPRCDPLIVSPGHRVSMAASAELVLRFVTTDRVPEPTRLAHLIALDEANDQQALS